MNNTLKPLSLGVITSLGDDFQTGARQVRELDLEHIQLSYRDHFSDSAVQREVLNACQQNGLVITTVFCGYDGESYADIPTVHATVGLVPPSTREARIAQTHVIAQAAHDMGIARVGAHIGFIPDDATHGDYMPLVEATRVICARLDKRNQVFALETGQETAATLHRFIHDVGATNLTVNFDPANMILYGNDNPIEATKLLAPHIDGVHCKDGTPPTQKNQLGHETPLGEGDVNLPLWIETLLATGFTGPLTIEREISGEEQRRDIAHAVQLLRSLLPQN